MKNILCFGDSNTFGKTMDGQRLPRKVRWTGKTQQLLGEDYYLIEDGLSGRTTIWEDPLKPNRSGLKTLPNALLTHQPLDLVILSLGTNDIKSYFRADAQEIAEGIGQLVQMIQKAPKIRGAKTATKIMIFAPSPVGERINRSHALEYDEVSRSKSMELATYYRRIAEEKNCFFFDGAAYATVGSDQLHLDEEGHSAIADAMAKKLTEIFG